MSEQTIEIAMLEPEPVQDKELTEPTPESKSALPLGSLDAPIHRAPTVSTSSPLPSAVEPEAAAPSVVTADNPYAAPNAAMFTSGTAVSTQKVVRKRTTAPGFGVENGSVDADPKRTKELQAWFLKVRAHFAAVAAGSYPRRALKLKQEGVVKLDVTIDESGKVLALNLAASSGATILDQAALSKGRTVQRVLAAPTGAGTNRMTIPLSYELKE